MGFLAVHRRWIRHHALSSKTFLATAAIVIGAVLLSVAPAHAQEPVWSFRFGGGALVATDTSSPIDENTTATLKRRAPFVSVDVARQLDCCLEVFIGALVPRIGVELSAATAIADASPVVPLGFQIGMNYRLHSRAQRGTPWKTGPYITLFVSSFSRDRSNVVRLPGPRPEMSGERPPDREVVFRFVDGVGAGFGLGGRYRLNDQFALDGHVKWQYFKLFAGDLHRIGWHPVVVSGGIVIRLY